MTLAKRIIPCLDIDNGRVVKGTKFIDIIDAGDPVEVAKRYDNEGADEITFLDITATHKKEKQYWIQLRMSQARFSFLLQLEVEFQTLRML